MKLFKWAALLIVFIALTIWATREVRYRMELSRRHHQIGQLWSLITLYYCPAHHDKYPSDLNELKQMPEYRPYFERAINEIDLLTPGIDRAKATDGYTIVLREKHYDERHHRFVHALGGMCGLEEPGFGE